MVGYLPQEILINILTRLPVKSLVKVRCVCKSWDSLIKSPSFISTHLRHQSTTSSQNNGLFLFGQHSCRSKTEWYSLHHYNRTFDQYMELDFPFPLDHDGDFRVVGSCNGLICIFDDPLGYEYTYFVWNPLISKSVTLPEPNFSFSTVGPFDHILGFGYDAGSDDYKLVRLVYLHRSEEPSPMVEVYSLREGVWKVIGNPFLDVWILDMYMKQGFEYFVNGAVHWLGYHEKRESCPTFVLSFNLGDEVFREIMLPRSLAHKKGSIYTCVLGQSISVLNDVKGKSFEVWVMKEYGMVESWTKQFTIDLYGVVDIWRKQLNFLSDCFYDVYGRSVTVLGFRGNHQAILLMPGRVLALYDSESNQFEYTGEDQELFSRWNARYSRINPFVESLVLLNQGN